MRNIEMTLCEWQASDVDFFRTRKRWNAGLAGVISEGIFVAVQKASRFPKKGTCFLIASAWAHSIYRVSK
ncbi:hypothetical protein [Bacillus coreaensis]